MNSAAYLINFVGLSPEAKLWILDGRKSILWSCRGKNAYKLKMFHGLNED